MFQATAHSLERILSPQPGAMWLRPISVLIQQHAWGKPRTEIPSRACQMGGPHMPWLMSV